MILIESFNIKMSLCFYSFDKPTEYQIPNEIIKYINEYHNNDYEIGLMNLLYEIIKNKKISKLLTTNINNLIFDKSKDEIDKEIDKFNNIYKSLQEFIKHKENDKVIPYTNLHIYINGLKYIPTNEIVHLYIKNNEY